MVTQTNTQETQLRLYYLVHTCNLDTNETTQYVSFEDINIFDIEKSILDLNNSSDGEMSYTPLYVCEVATGKVIDTLVVLQ